jgi:predicted amidohydrolase YtcJ
VSHLLLRQVEVRGRVCDVRTGAGRVLAVAPRLLPERSDEVVDGGGGALLPGLHDHHVHLLALAAARVSVSCGPPDVRDVRQLRSALRSAPPGAWVRGTGYVESVAGELDRWVLDRMVGERPVRVQHRSGALWIVNSAAVELLALDADGSRDVERDPTGTPTGRLWRFDAELRRRVGAEAPDLAGVGAELRALGITGVTDATPDLDDAACRLLVDAASSGVLPAELVLLGAPDGWPQAGPRKLLLRDHDLPGLDELTERVRAAHAVDRPVAVHVVTRASAVLTLAAIRAAGPLPGDRLEHGSVVPPEVIPLVRELGLRVVTQPRFVHERGDDYLAEVEADDLPYLYPYRSLLQAGVPVAPSSDAPYAALDPWQALVAASERRTAQGAELVPDERVDARDVLAGYLSPADDPGGPPRRVAPGAAADLCLLHVPLEQALAHPSRDHVRLVLRSGET